MAGWAVAVTRHPGPLAIDRRVSAALALDARWQDAGLRLLRLEGPVTVAVAAVVLAALAAALGAVRLGAAIAGGVAAEIVSVQWVLKPLVGRHELAPGWSFPSSSVGAVTALAAAAVLLCRPAGPIGRRLTRPGALTFSIGVVIVGVADIAVIAVAAIATGGHLFSDVVAVVPWAVALPVASHDLLVAPTPDTARRH